MIRSSVGHPRSGSSIILPRKNQAASARGQSVIAAVRGATAVMTRQDKKLDNANFELMYFDAKAAGENARMCFIVAGKPFTDTRYKFKVVEGGPPEIEERHKIDKSAGKFSANMDRLPVLKISFDESSKDAQEVFIGQSQAIERFLAKEFGLFGDDKLEAAQIDAFCENVRDIGEKFTKARGNPMKPPEDPEAVAEYWNKTLPDLLAKLEVTVSGNEGPYLFGENPTLADIEFQGLAGRRLVWQHPEKIEELHQLLMKDMPKLDNALANFTKIPAVADYLASQDPNAF